MVVSEEVTTKETEKTAKGELTAVVKKSKRALETGGEAPAPGTVVKKARKGKGKEDA